MESAKRLGWWCSVESNIPRTMRRDRQPTHENFRVVEPALCGERAQTVLAFHTVRDDAGTFLDDRCVRSGSPTLERGIGSLWSHAAAQWSCLSSRVCGSAGNRATSTLTRRATTITPAIWKRCGSLSQPIRKPSDAWSEPNRQRAFEPAQPGFRKGSKAASPPCNARSMKRKACVRTGTR